MELVIRYPDENDPGVLRYLRASALFNEILKSPSSHTVDEIDEAYKWLLGLVEEPKNRKKAMKLLMDLTVKQLEELFNNMAVNLEPDPKSQVNSGDG